ncbi:arylsulfatase B-like [Physella acuta]|uniref:arylsulfatase B-like n=1 Tax=Physella acuta TaxID=109671 RepID=UPI0027DC0E60|nr:arylsulfatase B-like [Physella acuta]
MILFWILMWSVLGVSRSKPASPHILFIVTDDLGWNDVGFHNPDIISPNIDALARKGTILNNSYVQPLCSPSRAAIMTGVFPYRYGLSHMVITDRQDVCVPTNMTMFPKILKAHGYSTHMIGKWHMGFCKWDCTPTYRGFDTFYGFYSPAIDYYTKQIDNGFDFRDNENVDKAVVGGYMTDQLADRVNKIINENNPDNPLFMFIAFNSVHDPLQVPQPYLDKYPNIRDKNRRFISGMVTSLDDNIGRITKTLKDKGMFNDTIIVFTSDNGGWTYFGGNNWPLRGGKLTIFEGGTRVPAFVHAPMLKEGKGKIYNGMIHAVDWFPTLLKAAGIASHDEKLDGVDQWDAIKSMTKSKRTEFVYNLDYHPFPLQGQAAIRLKDYKLIEGFPGTHQCWYQPDHPYQGPNLTYTDFFYPSECLVSWVEGQKTDKYLFNLKSKHLLIHS